jgi:integrase
MNELPKGVRVRSGAVEISYQVGGKRKFETLDLKPTKAGIAEAARVRAERMKARRFGIEPDDDSEPIITGTFSEVAQEYLNHAELAVSTRGSYRAALQTYWMPSLQHRDIRSIDLPMLRRLDRTLNWPSAKTRKNAFSALRQVFQFAIDDGYRQDNPADKFRIKRKKGAAPKPDPYTSDERAALLEWLEANAPYPIYVYYLVAFYTGMRTGELIALDWPNNDGASFMVDKSRVRGLIKSTKTDENRRVLVPDFVCTAVNKLPSRFKKRELFLNQYGRHYESGYHLNKVFRQAHAGTGIRHREGPYPWRHTYASIGLTNGAQPAFLAKQLGHSLQVFFTVYADWIEGDADRDQLAKLV